MSQSAYIKFVEGSTVESLSLEQVKEHLIRYKEQAALTGQQLDWDYANAAFPYTFESKQEGEGKWFYLKGINALYKYMIFGVGSEESEDKTTHYVQIVLPDGHSQGDKSKANEFCKYLGRHLQAQVKLFNGRTMYYNPRK